VVVPEVRETAVDYCVKMSAHHQVAGWSGWSNTACTAMPPWPNPPSGLTATVNGTTVHLQWTDNSAIETMYEVWALGVAGRTLPPNSTWYDWTGLAPATNYCFLVIARNATGPNGAPQVCVTTGGG
jgi:hypothetical protein